MKTKGSDKDYNFYTKKNWRQWAWNQMKSRLIASGKEPSKSIVLYLPGKDDLDREVALRKGFRNHNLIAIDWNKDNCRRIREKKGIAICGEIQSVLHSWFLKTRIDGAIIDLCGDFLIQEKTRIFGGWNTAIHANPGLAKKSVFIFNFLRGRNKNSSEEVHKNIDHSCIDIFKPKIINGKMSKDKHRGMNFYISMFFASISAMREISIRRGNWEEKETVDFMMKAFNYHICEEKPEIFTYRSGNLYFDSIAFNSRRFLSELDESDKYEIRKNRYHYSPDVEKSISSNMAIRTMRIEGTLR